MDGKLEPNPIMKFKLQARAAAATLILVASIATISAQPIPKGARAITPATGLPGPGGAPIVDPTAGLPVVAPAAPSASQWIDPNWSDPDVVLTNVAYDNLPLNEVAGDLRERFKDYFDILPMPKTFDHEWGNTPIELQLKNVKASDVFNAMNLVFENDRTPLRWELKTRGNRPTALLRVLAGPDWNNSPPDMDPTTGLPVAEKRGVYFVGNLLGDEKSGGMTMEKLVQTLSEVQKIGFGTERGIQFHKQAQLIIVTGTDEEITFIGNTLTALTQKQELDAVRKAQSKSAESKPNSEATKTP